MSTAVSIAEPLDSAFVVFDPFVRHASAVSSEAQALARDTTAVFRAIEDSEALFGKKSAAMTKLNEIADECSVDDWDGNGADAVDELAVLFAERFVRALPEDVPLPEFAPEPDGSISLDWIQSRSCLFSISVGRSQRLVYAWLDGSDKGHAVEHFSGEKVPPRILNGIRAILSAT